MHPRGLTHAALVNPAGAEAQRGLNPGGAGSAGVSDAQRWVQGGGRLPTLPLVSFLPPIPPTPFPGGEGGDFFHYFAGGFAPGTPALNRLQHL